MVEHRRDGTDLFAAILERCPRSARNSRADNPEKPDAKRT